MPDDSFKEFVLDQLGALPELRARGGFGQSGDRRWRTPTVGKSPRRREMNG
jgi:hypothetical protein